jgi:hypothetical protein
VVGTSPLSGPIATKLAAEKRLTFGALLRGMREDGGFTQKGLISAAIGGAGAARLSGLVVTALSHWEDDRRVPLPPQLAAVVRALREQSKDPETFDADLLSLITLARNQDHRYAGLVSMWDSGNFPAVDRLRSWSAWAATFPLRPPRGRAWERDDGEEDEDDESVAAPSGEAVAADLGVDLGTPRTGRS